MDPGIHAAADRFIYGMAGLKHVVVLIDERALVDDVGWDEVEEATRELAGTAIARADTLVRQLGTRALDDPANVSYDRDEPLIRLLDRAAGVLGGALRDAASTAPSPAPGEEHPLASRLDDWSREPEGLAFSFVDRVPELAGDILVLNWLLYADTRRNPDAAARQRRLFERARRRTSSRAEPQRERGR